MTRAVDLFSGAGGWSCGAEQAGVSVVAGANHWPRAIETFRAAHPEAQARCQDVALMDPRDLPQFDLLLASPACQGHSRARGTDQPHHDAQRATAWAVVQVAEVCRPRWIALENVPEFTSWVLYRHWRAALSTLGYRITERVLCASRHGVPQERRRWFAAASLERLPRLSSADLEPLPASSFVSFDGSDGWARVADKVERTRARVAGRTSERPHDEEARQQLRSDGARRRHRPRDVHRDGDRHAQGRRAARRERARDVREGASRRPAGEELACGERALRARGERASPGRCEEPEEVEDAALERIVEEGLEARSVIFAPEKQKSPDTLS